MPFSGQPAAVLALSQVRGTEGTVYINHRPRLRLSPKMGLGAVDGGEQAAETRLDHDKSDETNKRSRWPKRKAQRRAGRQEHAGGRVLLRRQMGQRAAAWQGCATPPAIMMTLYSFVACDSRKAP